jgi:hypothetical protein
VYDSSRGHSTAPLQSMSRKGLESNGHLQRSEGCRSREAVFMAVETWTKAVIEEGWR